MPDFSLIEDLAGLDIPLRLEGEREGLPGVTSELATGLRERVGARRRRLILEGGGARLSDSPIWVA
jgi:hypothetical protein